MSSSPPASIETTMLSKEIPRSALTASLFAGLQRNGFIGAYYAAVCLLSPLRMLVDRCGHARMEPQGPGPGCESADKRPRSTISVARRQLPREIQPRRRHQDH